MILTLKLLSVPVAVLASALAGDFIRELCHIMTDHIISK